MLKLITTNGNDNGLTHSWDEVDWETVDKVDCNYRIDKENWIESKHETLSIQK